MAPVKFRVRGLKQAFHWLFLAVGAFSVLMLAFSTYTYVSYAEDGYGMRLHVSGAELVGSKLYITFDASNPGKLDMAAWGWGNVTVGGGQAYGFYLALDLQAEKSSTAVASADLTAEDIAAIYAGAGIGISLPMSIHVPDRDLTTRTVLTAENLEVGT